MVYHGRQCVAFMGWNEEGGPIVSRQRGQFRLEMLIHPVPVVDETYSC